MNRSQLRESLTRDLVALADYLGAEVKDQRIAMYASDLADWILDNGSEYSVVFSTIHQLRLSQVFFPAMKVILDELEGSDRDGALKAWYRLRRLKGSTAYHLKALDDPVIFKVFMEMGGTDFFGTWQFDHEDFKIKAFVELYLIHRRDLRRNAGLALDWVDGAKKALDTLNKIQIGTVGPLAKLAKPEERPDELVRFLNELEAKRQEGNA